MSLGEASANNETDSEVGEDDDERFTPYKSSIIKVSSEDVELVKKKFPTIVKFEEKEYVDICKRNRGVLPKIRKVRFVTPGRFFQLQYPKWFDIEEDDPERFQHYISLCKEVPSKDVEVVKKKFPTIVKYKKEEYVEIIKRNRGALPRIRQMRLIRPGLFLQVIYPKWFDVSSTPPSPRDLTIQPSVAPPSPKVSTIEPGPTSPSPNESTYEPSATPLSSPPTQMIEAPDFYMAVVPFGRHLPDHAEVEEVIEAPNLDMALVPYGPHQPNLADEEEVIEAPDLNMGVVGNRDPGNPPPEEVDVRPFTVRPNDRVPDAVNPDAVNPDAVNPDAVNPDAVYVIPTPTYFPRTGPDFPTRYETALILPRSLPVGQTLKHSCQTGCPFVTRTVTVTTKASLVIEVCGRKCYNKGEVEDALRNAKLAITRFPGIRRAKLRLTNCVCHL